MRLMTFNDMRVLLGGRGRTTIYRDVHAGRLPQPIKIGQRVYWDQEEVETAIQEMKEQTNGF